VWHGRCSRRQRDVVPILIEGLKRLEYRGYDSAGVAIIDASQSLACAVPEGGSGRQRGTVRRLHGGTGIAHTRWANARRAERAERAPAHLSQYRGGVHNGIIEEHEQFACRAEEKGFTSSPRKPTPR